MFNFISRQFKKLSEGNRTLDEDLKYSLLVLLLSVIHFGFALFYYFLDTVLLVFYNLGSGIFYLYLYRLITKKKKYWFVLNIMLAEVIFFAGSSTLVLGWDFGYMLYFMCLIPVIFYLLFTSEEFYGNLKLPLLYSCGVSAAFIIIRVLYFHITPWYDGMIDSKLVSAMYLFNSFVSCFFQTIFSLLFVVEIIHSQNALKSQNSLLDNLANLDPLTQLCNRRSMEHHLTHSMEVSKATGDSFSVIIGDIDNFKLVNDTYGHEFGDKVLENVARILKNQMREEDFACRWGGEEFLLLIHANQEDAWAVGERVRSEIEKSTVTDGTTTLSVTMTFGVTDFIPGCDIEKLIAIADAKLYKGKTNGKNQVVT